MSTFIFPSNSKTPPPSEVKKTQQPLFKKIDIKTPVAQPTPVTADKKEQTNHVVETTKKQDNYTHILSILIQHNKTPNKPVAEYNREILKQTAKILHNVVHTKMLGNNFYAPIAWVQQGSVYSNKYYMNNEFLGDVAVKKHTDLLLEDVIKQIDDLFDFAFSKKETVLIFEITKPLTIKNVLF